MKIFKEIILGLSVATFLVAVPTLSFADGNDHHGDDHHGDHHSYHYVDHPHWGVRLSWIPDTYFLLNVDGFQYYYYDGLYYQRLGRDYVVIAPPIGAVVRDIPRAYHPIVINGVTYYTDSGTYYVYTRNGYQVVPTPVQYVQPMVYQPALANPAPVVNVTPSPAVVDADESFTVNIPNDQNGYTAVIIKRSGNGFVGPQGEFYASFPKVTQLKVMYAK